MPDNENNNGPPREGENLPPAVEDEKILKWAQQRVSDNRAEYESDQEENFEGAGEQVVHDDEHLV